MNKKFLTMAGVVAVLSSGTFWGLEILKPHKVDEARFPPSVSVDQVFANKLNPNGAPDQSVAAANAAAVATPAGSDTTAATTVATPAAENPAAATGSENTATTGASTESANPSSTPAEPGAPAESSGNEVAAAAPGPATSEPAQTSSSPAESAGTASTPSPATAPATTASSPAESSAPAASAPAETSPAEAAPAPKPAPARKHVAHAAKPAHHPATGSTQTRHSRWWPAENPAHLSLVYAGPASFKKAVVLMFNGAFFKTDGLDQNLKVTGKNGQPVAGSWEIGENNRRMLVFPVPGDGQYKVSIGTGLTDSKGRKIAHSLSGPVTVR
jgi:hypothetical protein